MDLRALSMRWWLALAFAGIAALTALVIAQVFTARSEAAIRERAEELVAGAAVAAAARVPTDASADAVAETLDRFGAQRGLALFAFSADGRLLTPERARGIAYAELPNGDELLDTALAGRRVVESVDGGRLVTVALPLRREQAAALVAVAPRSDLDEALGIVRDEIVKAAAWATAIAAIVGLVVAMLITRRLRGIAHAAADIEQGRFDRALRPRFHDELGALAETIDRMRERLRASFRELEGERDRLERLLEQLQEGVVAVDRELTVEFANSRARLLLGATLEPGSRLPEPCQELSLAEAIRRAFLPRAEAETIRADVSGSRYVIAVLPPAAGSSTSVIVLTDVTEQERRERAEREFVSNAAHELRTPLAAIASAVEVLQSGAKQRADDRDRFLAVVERQTDRLTRLVHALLTLARAQTRSERVRLETVALEPLVREIADDLAEARVEVRFCCGGVDVLAHRDLLRQALENLTANAVKHAPDAALAIRVAHIDRGHLVRVDVTDEGPGMTRAQRERAFDRFYRAGESDGDGFGLGLPIVREAVAAMGGDLEIESAPGAGTTVSIVLRGAPATRSCT